MKKTMKRYIVGGYVRDKLSGKSPQDRDWVVVGATEAEMLAAGFQRVGAGFPVFLHPDTKEDHALARKDIKTGAGHRGFAFDFSKDVTLDEDLLRRDFTVNCLVTDESENLIKTALNERALRDLENRTLDIVDINHFAEDPLRAVRAARFAATLGFKMTERTRAECVRMADSGELSFLPAERFCAEFIKAFDAKSGGAFVENLHDLKALSAYCPALESLFSCPEKVKYHPEGHTGGHVVNALKWLDRNIDSFDLNKQDRQSVYWAVLLHDIGKPLTDPAEFPRHIGHDKLGADLLRTDFCARLKLPSFTAKLCRFVCENHMRFHHFPEMRKATKFDFVFDIYKRTDDKPMLFLIACLADRYCNRTGDGWRKDFKDALGFISTVYEQASAIRLTAEEIDALPPEKRAEALRQKRLAALSDFLFSS
ncbi:MAG: HD domain-containing protein [Alphaproteobacteria bacterium]|nr:HD domain-containing protein [Alphaproteobacteria bacterium]